MRGRRDNLIGQKFGRLTVTEYVGKDPRNHTKWKCECECGKIIIARGCKLKEGGHKSCGCYKAERDVERNITHGMTIGKRMPRLYRIWLGMKTRCNNPNEIAKWERYGGRGIEICEEWEHDFMAFYDWAINNGYSDELTIDRIDNDGNYEPSNCRWATKSEQRRNQSPRRKKVA